MSYPYAEHDNGVVLTQPRPGEFERRPMTAGELAAREPALKIAKDIYRHANQAGVCYYEFWRLIADAIDACARPEALRSGWIPLAERKPPYRQDVLVIDHDISGGAHVALGMLFKGHGEYFDTWALNTRSWVNGPTYERVTHWMPLPEPALTGADAQCEGRPAAASVPSPLRQKP